MAEECNQRDMARAQSELHALAFSHVDGGIYSRYGLFVHFSLTCEYLLLFSRFSMHSLSLNQTVDNHWCVGLGDRHPSNLMLDRISGKVAHVDFGDCFEVAMHREKFPEKIPFRLTRMLVHAMEVTGIEGTRTSSSMATSLHIIIFITNYR